MDDLKDEMIIEKAVNLSLIEITLGSVLHAFKVPFSGQTLSLHQGLFFTRVAHSIENRFRCSKIIIELSVIVSMMKSFSPAGKKLGPMISISMQGLLYSIGIFILGSNLLGQILGMFLLSLWAFIQPLITYFLIYGMDLVKAFDYFVLKLNQHISITPDNIFYIVFTVIFIKIVIAMLIPILLKLLPSKIIDHYDVFIARINLKKIKRSNHDQPIMGAIKDMAKPFFIFSLLLMITFFYLTGDDNAFLLWKTLRTIAMAFVIFYLSRSKTFFRLVQKLFGKSKFFNRMIQLAQKAYLRIVQN